MGQTLPEAGLTDPRSLSPIPLHLLYHRPIGCCLPVAGCLQRQWEPYPTYEKLGNRFGETVLDNERNKTRGEWRKQIWTAGQTRK